MVLLKKALSCRTKLRIAQESVLALVHAIMANAHVLHFTKASTAKVSGAPQTATKLPAEVFVDR